MGTGLYKLVNGEMIELTEAEDDARKLAAENVDKNPQGARSLRDDLLKETDKAVSVPDYPLPTGTVDEWKTYRTELRDCLTSFERRSTFNFPKSPIVVKAGTDAYNAKKAEGLTDYDYSVSDRDISDIDSATDEDLAAFLEERAEVERSAAEGLVGYPRSGLTNTT